MAQSCMKIQLLIFQPGLLVKLEISAGLVKLSRPQHAGSVQFRWSSGPDQYPLHFNLGGHRGHVSVLK